MDTCESAIWVGKALRVALWCTYHHAFLGNPATVQEANALWDRHVAHPDEDEP